MNGIPEGKGANGDTQAHAKHPHKGMKILKFTLFTNTYHVNHYVQIY